MPILRRTKIVCRFFEFLCAVLRFFMCRVWDFELFRVQICGFFFQFHFCVQVAEQQWRVKSNLSPQFQRFISCLLRNIISDRNRGQQWAWNEQSLHFTHCLNLNKGPKLLKSFNRKMWLYGNYFHLLSKTIRLKSIQNIIMIPLNVMTVNMIWISLRNQLWDKLVSGQRIGRQGTNFPSFPRFEPSSFFDSSSSERNTFGKIWQVYF